MYLLKANQESCCAAEANSVKFSASAWTLATTWTWAGSDGTVDDDVSEGWGTTISSIAADCAGSEIASGGVWLSTGAAAAAAAVLLSSAIAGELWTVAWSEEELGTRVFCAASGAAGALETDSGGWTGCDFISGCVMRSPRHCFSSHSTQKVRPCETGKPQASHFCKFLSTGGTARVSVFSRAGLAL